LRSEGSPSISAILVLALVNGVRAPISAARIELAALSFLQTALALPLVATAIALPRASHSFRKYAGLVEPILLLDRAGAHATAERGVAPTLLGTILVGLLLPALVRGERMEHFTPFRSILGGGLIGLSASAMDALSVPHGRRNIARGIEKCSKCATV
jgi:hypothetical protein